MLVLASLVLGACGGGGDGRNGDDPNGGSPGQFRFANTTATISEAGGNANLTIERVGGTSGIVSVAVMSADGTATAGLDYTAVTTRVNFGDGDATPQVVMLPIADDTTAESDETLTVTLANPMGGATLPSPADTTATITIRDNDGPGATSLVTSVVRKGLAFQWDAARNAASYKLMRRLSATADFVPVIPDLAVDPAAAFQSTQITIPLHLYPWTGVVPEYRLDSCVPAGCTPSNIVTHDRILSALATTYIKASDTSAGARFGSSVAVSADGKTVAIGAPFANGEAGAVYIYLALVGSPQLSPNPLRIPAPSAQAMHFGASVALSEDGNTLVVGAPFDNNNQAGIGTYPATPNTNAPHSGGVFVYTRNPGLPLTFSTPVYIKAIDADTDDMFGTAVALKDTVIVVGAPGQDSPTMGAGTNEAPDSGAAYMFYANAGTWATPFTNPLKADDIVTGDRFGTSVAVSRGGSVAIIGAPNSAFIGAANAGVAYRFERAVGSDGTPTWNLRFQVPVGGRAGDLFGSTVAVSADGTTFGAGAPRADDPVTGTTDAGRVCLFTSTNMTGAFSLDCVTAKYPHENAQFGSALALNGDGTVLAVGSPGESADEIGVDGGADAPLTLSGAGAVDAWTRQPGVVTWSGTDSTKHYVKPIVADTGDQFGFAVGLSSDGSTLVVGANGEDGNGTNIGNDDVADSGAAYLF